LVAKGSIREQWLDYQKRVVPRDAGPVQVRETYLAFYAGAVSLLVELDAIAELRDPAAEAARIAAINRELNEFCDEARAL